MTAPIVVTNLRRTLKPGPVVGGLTLRVPSWRLVIMGSIWLRNGSDERILLPRRQWLDAGGAERTADIFCFDDFAAQDDFERQALAAAKRLLKASTR